MPCSTSATSSAASPSTPRRSVSGSSRASRAGRRSCRPRTPPTTTTSACSRSARGAGDSTAGRSTVGLYHLAWEVDTLAELQRIRGVLTEHGALVGASDHGSTKALYAKDPDGIEFEVSWLVPAALLDPEQTITTAPLHLERDIERYGADTRGGVGVSVPTA